MSFVAKSWQMGILKNKNSAKSSFTKFRFETVLHLYEINNIELIIM
jgi:hypothetical protein